MINLFKKNKKGFTLIELIVVIAILAILAAIAIPTFTGITASANDAVKQANASNIATAYNAYNALNPNDPLGTPASAKDLKEAVGTNLWPAGLSDTDAEAAFKLITFSNGFADVGEASASASPSL